MRFKKFIFPTIGVLILGGIGYGVYTFVQTYKTLSETKNAFALYQNETIATIDSLSAQLSELNSINEKLILALQNTEAIASSLDAETKTLGATVRDYEKLKTLDPQLLQKYSKVYFLNEHYTPRILKEIDQKFVNGKDRELDIHGDVAPFLDDMLSDAKDEGLNLLVTSAYRSFTKQASLKAAYRVTYGTGANRFSADQGYSEHQLGTTVDVMTNKMSGLSTSFETTPEFKWLTLHAHKYGFVLSYPKNNKYYIYEPWHWRFVGIPLATKLYEDKKYLYDLDQRDIDGYLLTMFDA